MRRGMIMFILILSVVFPPFFSILAQDRYPNKPVQTWFLIDH